MSFYLIKRKLLLLLGLIYILSGVKGQMTKLNSKRNNPNELTIAINPLQPSYLAAASNINNIYLSHDSGVSWVENEVKSSYGVFGDPVLRYSPDGILFYVHLAYNRNINREKENIYQSLDRIVIQTSADNGVTFSDGIYCGLSKGRMQDKPWISFDGRGYFYITWTEFDNYASADSSCHSRIRCFRSDFRGIDTTTRTISEVQGNCLDNDSTPEGATLTVLKNGDLVSCWAFDQKIFISRSFDKGLNWKTDSVQLDQSGGWTRSVPGIYRTNGLPFIQSDSNDNLYVLFSATCEQNLNCDDIFLYKQNSHGKKLWERIVIPIPDSKLSKNYIFMPNIFIDNNANTLYMVMYQTYPYSVSFARVIAVQAQCTDSLLFQYFSPHVNPFPLSGSKQFFGDYLDINSAQGITAMAWNQQDSAELNAFAAVVKDSDFSESLKWVTNPVIRFEIKDEITNWESILPVSFKNCTIWIRKLNDKKCKPLKISFSNFVDGKLCVLRGTERYLLMKGTYEVIFKLKKKVIYTLPVNVVFK